MYGVGPRSLTPGTPRPWRPSTAQLDHTLAIERTLVAILRPGFAEPVQVTGWEGESEIRAWALPGSAFPDLVLRWRVDGRRGSWSVEVDRATESRAALRRKLVRYLMRREARMVLVVTTTQARAKNIARIASEIGAPVLVTTSAAIAEQQDPDVLDSIRRCRTRLSVATQAIATESIS
jgi:hypothetical protein